MKRARCLPVALVALTCASSTGCPPAEGTACLAEARRVAWPGLRSVVAARDDGGVRVRGFSGAVAAGAEVTLQAGDSEPATVVADDRGRFETLLNIDADAVTLTVGEEKASLRVRDLEDALSCVPGAALAVGTTPNDLEIGRCGTDLLALVPASADGSLEAVVLSGAAAPSAIPFPPDDDGHGANPWAVALHEDGVLAAVTLFGQHAVALMDACTGEVLHVAEALDDEGAPLVVAVTPPVPLSTAQDADGDGTAEAQVSRMLVRHPEGVAFVGDRLLVSYTNLLEVGPPARFGPGLVVAFHLEGDALVPAGHSVLSFRNPQSITLDDEGRPWVSSSGVLERGAASFEAASDGGLLRLDPATLAELHVIDLGRFAPGTPAVTRDGIVVGSLLEGRLAHLPPDAVELSDGKLLDTRAGGSESLFEVVSVGGGLALAAGFTTDALHVVDLEQGTLHPWPFVEPLVLGAGGDVFRGLKSVARTPDEALAPGAPEAAALLGLSSEVVPLHLWQVMGP